MDPPPEPAPLKNPRHTPWDLLRCDAEPASDRSQRAAACLYERYLDTLAGHLRQKGWKAADASEMAHDFLVYFIRSGCLRRARQSSGRLRGYLYTAFRRYLRARWLREQTHKRGGDQLIVPFDRPSQRLADAAAAAGQKQSSVAEADRSWGLQCLEDAVAELQAEYEAAGRGPLYHMLAPYWGAARAERLPLLEISYLLDRSVANLRSDLKRLRVRFQAKIRAQVMRRVGQTAFALEWESLCDIIRQGLAEE